MSFEELSTLVLIMVGLGALRFGVPMLVMWLLKMGCCRILHLTPR